jgi:hypothetical protein
LSKAEDNRHGNLVIDHYPLFFVVCSALKFLTLDLFFRVTLSFHFVSSPFCFRYQNRYILLAGLSALLAFSFHASVNRRFSLMEDGLKTAATIRYAMEWDELMELEYHNEAYKHNQDSVRHLMLAFEYAHEAYLLQKNITREQQDIKDLEADAEEEKKRANSDELEASMWAIRAFGDGRTTVGAELTGIELAKRAYDENERGQEALEHANQTLVAGTEKLHQAQESLQFAEEDKNHTKIDKGICHWMPVACNIVRGHASPNATYPATPTDMAIQANKDLFKMLSNRFKMPNWKKIWVWSCSSTPVHMQTCQQKS